MTIVIPIRLATAILGLVLGYYAGVWVEHKSKYKDLIAFLADTSKIAEKARDAAKRIQIPPLDYDHDYTDDEEDEDFPEEYCTDCEGCSTSYSD